VFKTFFPLHDAILCQGHGKPHKRFAIRSQVDFDRLLQLHMLDITEEDKHLMRRFEAEDSEVPDNELIELVLRDVGLEYIPKRAILVYKYYMRQPRGLYMGLNTSVQLFVERLNDLNRYLLYFPEENPNKLDQDEIIETLDQAKVR
jgi:hypothetical protein